MAKRNTTVQNIEFWIADQIVKQEPTKQTYKYIGFFESRSIIGNYDTISNMTASDQPTTQANRPTMRHRLRIAAAWFCLVLCFCFMALWVRSYFVWDVLSGPVSEFQKLTVGSIKGRAILGTADYRYKHVGRNVNGGWAYRTVHKENMTQVWDDYVITWSLGFDWGKAATEWTLHVPYWFLSLVSGGLAILMKPKPRLRFSLRELLLLTTIAAIVLGTVAALGRVVS